MKKICIVADVKGWAFDHIAQKIKKELSYKYDIRIDYLDRIKQKEYFFELIEKNDDCDLIHFLNRRILLLYKTNEFKEKVEKSGRNYDEYILEKKNKFSTAVNDYLDLDPNGIQNLKPIYNEYTNSYYTSAKELFDIYSSIAEFKKPDTMIHDLCDEQIFFPSNLDRFKYNNINNRSITIGWIGNSIHPCQGEVDLKGFHSILKPVIQQLQEEGYNLKEFYADRNDKWRSPKEMQEYYSEIDLCICTSLHEGTPLPILEAMYCGIPIISTNVGIVSEALGEKAKTFIISNRDNGRKDEIVKKELKQKIIEFYNNRELFEELSNENLETIIKFDGGKTIKQIDAFFEKCLNS